MPVFTVGPNSTYPNIADAMAAAGNGDTIALESGYSNETASVTHSGMIITGDASSTGIVLQLAIGVATVTLAGTASIDLSDAADGNGIVGNDGDNLITVTAGADAVNGGLGGDRLFVDYRLATGAITGDSTTNVAEAGGGARLTTINGGFENFTIWTGSGADTLTTGAGDDDIRTGDGASTVTAGEGANFIVGGSGADTVVAGDGGNQIYGGDGANTLTTGSGSDFITGGVGADTVVSGGGDDVVEVTGGADTVDAGAANDMLVVDYRSALTSVTGGVVSGNGVAGHGGHIGDLAGTSVDFLTVEQFQVSTGAGNDSIVTGDNVDWIATGDGNDSLDGGGGADLLTGGAGDDIYFVDDTQDRTVELNELGTDAVFSSASFSLMGQYVENLTLTGTGMINAVGNGLSNSIIGNGSANIIKGAGGTDTMSGGAGNDHYIVDSIDDVVLEVLGEGYDRVDSSVSYTLADHVEGLRLTGGAAIDGVGNGLANTLTGNLADNWLDGGTGADMLKGGAGDDGYIVDNLGDKAFEQVGEGNDTVWSSVSYLLAGQQIENLVLTGTGATRGTGNSLDNVITGNSGLNQLRGMAGDDTYVIQNALDKVFELDGDGFDTILSSVSYALAGQHVEALTLTGAGHLNGDGNSLTNILTGNAGNNVLNGREGNDDLNGGLGADTLNGGIGADRFWFDTALGAGNVDSIRDFSAVDDTIMLDLSIFTGLSAGVLDASAFRLGAVAQDADDRIVYDRGAGQIYYDSDGSGDGAAVLLASVKPATAMSATDFMAY